jgi:hypothetical protein
MEEPTLLDRTYHFIIATMKEKGVAPHYTEIAEALQLSVEEGRQKLEELMAAGIPGIWLAPGTDYIQSFAPFSNLPTQYRISVEGTTHWFGQ